MHDISKEEPFRAWERVKKAGGGAGYDGKKIQDVQLDLDNQLYKTWNRLSSGSYMAAPVLLVEIPKAGGGKRTLGIPTVMDRVAQMVIKDRLEQILEPKFHKDSYAYRPDKSAIDAVGKARERCFQRKWVIDLDIKGFFDNIDHSMMMEFLLQHTKDKTIVMYVQRFLTAKAIKDDGTTVERTKGTPQGGVISPLLANLYLHEAFDMWMKEHLPNVQFERYADDVIAHCATEKQAQDVLEEIRERLLLYKLELHPEKTKIIYVGSGKDPENKPPRKFTFLGYEFKPRGYVKDKIWHMTFTPSIGAKALKAIQIKMDEWSLHSRTFSKLSDISQEKSAIIRGWIEYYGHYRRSELYKLAIRMNWKLVRWLKRKHKSLRSTDKAWQALRSVKKGWPKLFPHWHMIPTPPTRAV